MQRAQGMPETGEQGEGQQGVGCSHHTWEPSGILVTSCFYLVEDFTSLFIRIWLEQGSFYSVLCCFLLQGVLWQRDSTTD